MGYAIVGTLDQFGFAGILYSAPKYVYPTFVFCPCQDIRIEPFSSAVNCHSFWAPMASFCDEFIAMLAINTCSAATDNKEVLPLCGHRDHRHSFAT